MQLSLPAFFHIERSAQARQLLLQLSPYYVGRAYHNMLHVQAMLSWLELEYEPHLSVDDCSALCYAILFHDIIYDATARDNEAASAGMVRRYLGVHLAYEQIEKIVSLIQATAYYLDIDKAKDIFITPLHKIMAELDLSIFIVESRAGLEQFEQQIRQEYAHVPVDTYRLGRHQVLCDLEKFFLIILDFSSASLAVQNCRYLQHYVLHYYV